MEFIIDRAEFLKGLYLTQSVVERRTTQPILSHVLLEATLPILDAQDRINSSPKEGWVKLTATDMEVGIETTLPATIIEPGSLCLGAKKTYEIIRELPEQTVKFIKKEENWLEIQCGKALFRLMTLPPEEFPQISFSHIGPPIYLEARTLKEMIDKTIFAVGSDETKYILNGALLELCDSQNSLRMVATDGHRLAMIERALPAVPEKIKCESSTTNVLAQGIVLPKKALMELSRFLESGEISISFSDAVGIIKDEAHKGGPNSQSSAFSFFVRLLQGEFPDYRRVIPSNQENLTIKVDRNNLIHILKRVSILSTDRYKIVKLSIGDGKAIISVVNPDLGEAKEDLEIGYQGPNLEIGFNAFYLLEALNSIDSAQISIELKDEISATLIKAGGRTDQLNLIMPIRI